MAVATINETAKMLVATTSAVRTAVGALAGRSLIVGQCGYREAAEQQLGAGISENTSHTHVTAGHENADDPHRTQNQRGAFPAHCQNSAVERLRPE